MQLYEHRLSNLPSEKARKRHTNSLSQRKARLIRRWGNQLALVVRTEVIQPSSGVHTFFMLSGGSLSIYLRCQLLSFTRRSFSFPSSHYCTHFSLYLKKSFFHAGAFVSDGILAASSRVALDKVDLRSRELINRSVLPHKHLDGLRSVLFVHPADSLSLDSQQDERKVQDS